MDPSGIRVDRREICRYLGLGGKAPGAELEEKIERCLAKLLEASQPQSTRLFFPLSHPEENTLETAGMVIHSKNLSKNMKGCRACCLFAATIGPGCDRLIQRSELTSIADTAVYQAAGAALIEAYCDRVNEEIREEAEKKGLHARPRFSPGYGDFSLEHQLDFERILHMKKTCGIGLSDTLLMSPSKSVTAIIGLSDTSIPCIIQGCETCENASRCAYRR